MFFVCFFCPLKKNLRGKDDRYTTEPREKARTRSREMRSCPGHLPRFPSGLGSRLAVTVPLSAAEHIGYGGCHLAASRLPETLAGTSAGTPQPAGVGGRRPAPPPSGTSSSAALTSETFCDVLLTFPRPRLTPQPLSYKVLKISASSSWNRVSFLELT